MIENPARFLFIGAGTKTGKTVGLELRAAKTIARRQPVAWSGSVLAKTKKTYRRLKQILAPALDAGALIPNDSTGTLFDHEENPLFVSFTGEHPEAIFGDGYKLFVIDEASRQPPDTYYNAITTTSATRGTIACAFNLDHGARNWAVKKLIEVQKMTPAERLAKSQDFMLFPTMSEPWVDQLTYEEARTSGMPRALFDALYNAVIPTDDVSLFANLDALFTGDAPKGPDRTHTYIAGVDLGRKTDFTVATVLDVTARRYVAAIRLYKVGWTLQYERIAQLYRSWGCARAWVDQSGLGDPVVEELEERGMAVDGYIFSEPSRKALIEAFSAACDGRKFTAPDTEGEQGFKIHKQELGSFEIVVSKSVQGKITYRVPEGHHDDAAFSMMLAWWGAEQGNFGPPRIERVGRTLEDEKSSDVGSDFRSLRGRNDLSGF